VTVPARLLAVDIDGTLLNSKFNIAQPDLNAIRAAHDLGVEVILCTGRRHTFALPIANMLGFDMWLCTSNGAVTRSTAGETFHRDLLPADVARELCGHMNEYRTGTVITFDKDAKGALIIEDFENLHHRIQRWMQVNHAYIELVRPIENALTADPIQAMFCGTVAEMEVAEKHLAQFARLGDTTVLKTQYDDRDLCLLDVLNKDCCKGHAVERWAAHRGIDQKQVIAIGDNYNDLGMLEFAGMPVVMANASDDMKQRGWMETKSNDDFGIAWALHELLGTPAPELVEKTN
jgi:Cof subfamily protein (haloacid dehalogenase superfamily)